MKLLYFPDTDTLSIQFPPSRAAGQDTNDPHILLFFDESNRISEVLIENASRRLDLDSLRNQPQFEEMTPKAQA